MAQDVQTETAPPCSRRLRRTLLRLMRWAAYSGAGVALLVLFWLRSALYDHWVRFPRQQAAWMDLRAQRRPTLPLAGWHDYRGILHSHSRLSHDCEVSFEEILRALQSDGLDFICLSDHCVDGRADFDWQWRGFHEGKLFIPGFEMRDGFMPFGVATGTVLSNQTDSATLARQVVEHGGVLFFAHPEEPRDWERPELTGMEIYNIHSELKRYPGGVGALLPDILLNQKRYPDQVFRLLFHRPTDFLEHWDQLNTTRHITGIAGNDCHQNTGLRAIYTAADRVRLEDTGRKTLAQVQLNWLTRWIARVGFRPLTPGRELFHVQLDPYERMARFVNTHVLAQELSESAVLDALRHGRVFIGFDMIADSTGFQWWADQPGGQVLMGESGAFWPQASFHARSPVPCRFSIIFHGQSIQQTEGRALDWQPAQPGKYRLEAELRVVNDWVPWVYTNPIELRAP